MDTLLIQVTNEKALGLLRELEELHFIKVLKGKPLSTKTKLSEKYKGILSKEEGNKLTEHIKKMRGEWSGI